MWRRKGPAGSPGGPGAAGPPGPPGPPGSIQNGNVVGNIAEWNGALWVPNGAIVPVNGNILVFDGTNWVPTAAGNGIAVTAGGSVSTTVANNFVLPSAAVAAALANRPFHYVAPDPASSGFQQIGMQSNALTGAAWVATTNADLLTSLSRIKTISTTNTLIGHNFTNPGMCRGAVPGVGGFFFRHRFAIVQIQATSAVCVGCNTSAIATNGQPSATGNRIVFGCDGGDANITLITTDNVGGSTKTALTTPITKASMITGDPNTNGPCVFEVTMYALPNAASVHCKLQNVSTGAILHDADIAVTLPLNTNNLRPTNVMWSPNIVASEHHMIDFTGFW